MSTSDFIKDAIDSLSADDDTGHILIAAKFESEDCVYSSHVPTKEHLEWMKRRFKNLCDRIEESFKNRS